MICYICQNEVYIPVELICFPCYKRNSIHCMTYVRICVSCAFPYLQLDKSLQDRTNVKCLFCSKFCDTKQLTLENSFVFDYLKIREHQVSGSAMCPLCLKIISTNITEHLKNDCPHYYEQCVCGRVSTREWMSLHKRYCQKYHQCSLCKEYVEKSEFELHCFQKHDLLLCERCGQYISVHDFSFHVHHSCSKRLVQCDFCPEKIYFPEYEDHLLEHEKDIQSVMESVREMSMLLFRKFASIKKRRSELFQNFYLES